jgi:hypothetical protein
MGPRNTLMMKLTMGAAAAGLSLLSLMPSSRAERTTDHAVRELVYGRADAAWTRDASAMATMSPAFAEELARLCESNEVGPLGRSRAIEALAQSGTPEAQTTLRAVLDRDAVQADAAYPLLMARLGAVQSPTTDTIAYLGRTHEAAVAASATELAAASESALHDAMSNRVANLIARRHQARTFLGHKR